jgi:hypothetical protein
VVMPVPPGLRCRHHPRPWTPALRGVMGVLAWDHATRRGPGRHGEHSSRRAAAGGVGASTAHHPVIGLARTGEGAHSVPTSLHRGLFRYSARTRHRSRQLRQIAVGESRTVTPPWGCSEPCGAAGPFVHHPGAPTLPGPSQELLLRAPSSPQPQALRGAARGSRQAGPRRPVRGCPARRRRGGRRRSPAGRGGLPPSTGAPPTCTERAAASARRS